jgi:hypothetical protein
LQSDETFDFVESKLVDQQGRFIDVEVSSVRIHRFMGNRVVIQSIFRDISEIGRGAGQKNRKPFLYNEK